VHYNEIQNLQEIHLILVIENIILSSKLVLIILKEEFVYAVSDTASYALI